MAELTVTQPLRHQGARYSAAVRRRRARHLLEAMSAIILALGGVTSAWSGHEASLLDGQQASAYARAGALRASSTRSMTTAGQLADIDVLMFLSWASANTRGERELRDFVAQRFRPEFKPVFDAWVATEPLREPSAPSSPFQMPEYSPRHAEDAARLQAEADRLQHEGDLANLQGDRYSRAGLIFALSLFFIAVAQQFKSLSVRSAVIVTAGAIMAYGLWAVAQLPRVVPG